MNKTQTVEERLSMILNNLITCSSNIGLGEEYFIVSLSMCFGKRNKSKPMIDDLMDKVVSKIKQELKKAYKKGLETPHGDTDGWCCACEYDQIILNKKLKANTKKVIDIIAKNEGWEETKDYYINLLKENK